MVCLFDKLVGIITQIKQLAVQLNLTKLYKLLKEIE